MTSIYINSLHFNGINQAEDWSKHILKLLYFAININRMNYDFIGPDDNDNDHNDNEHNNDDCKNGNDKDNDKKKNSHKMMQHIKMSIKQHFICHCFWFSCIRIDESNAVDCYSSF